MENEIKALANSIIEGQKKKLLDMGRSVIPYLTTEDIMQPNDYPELENNPLFRYEEGILEGMQTLQMAIQAYFKEKRLHRIDEEETLGA